MSLGSPFFGVAQLSSLEFVKWLIEVNVFSSITQTFP